MTPVEARAWVAGRAGRTALCLDFDGTLAPIVADPEQAVPLPGMGALLARLAGRFAAVALVSGRPAAYLLRRLPVPGLRYLGLYGVEEVVDGQVRAAPGAAAFRPALRRAAAELAADPAVAGSGARLEDKGLSLALHWRTVADQRRWAGRLRAAAEEAAARHGLDALPARMACELWPPVGHDKGAAVRRVAEEAAADAVVAVGDDLGDLAAFGAVSGLAAEGREGLRVAVRSAEAPAELLAAADLVVDGPEGVRALLEAWAG